jgi:hypothetical protein
MAQHRRPDEQHHDLNNVTCVALDLLAACSCSAARAAEWEWEVTFRAMHKCRT